MKWKQEDLIGLLPFATNRQKQVVESVLKNRSLVGASRDLGVDISTVGATLRRIKLKSQKRAKARGDEVRAEQTQDGLLLEVKSFDRIQTAHEAMQKAGIDQHVWEPIKIIANSWEVAVKLDSGDVETCPLWQVKVTCRRRIPASIENATDALAKKAAQKLTLPKITRSKGKNPSTMVLGLVDHHFGKLCWKPEVGDDYDLKIAEDLWYASLQHHLDRWSRYDLSKIIIPIGNDFGHIDTRTGTTEAGTYQDVDGRYEKIAYVMEEAAIKCVLRAREIADVDVIWVGGNHDRVTSMWICRCIHWAFEKCQRVSVDTSPKLVKYRHFDNCLLGFSHGDGPREKSLKDMMPLEMPDAWAKSKACREWITGHLHQQKTVERISTWEQAGMVFRILPSLAGTDRWHYSNGFNMSQRASQSLLYSNNFGFSDLSTYHIGRFIEGV